MHCILLVILSACTFNGALFRLANPPKGKKYEILNNKNWEKLNEKWVKSSEMSQISKRKDLQQGYNSGYWKSPITLKLASSENQD